MNLLKRALSSFLLAAAIAAPSFAAPASVAVPSPNAAIAQFDVVVIGGGIAGLTTVEMLRRKGITNVLLLEQAPRVGGKMWTERTENGPHYERGAELVNTSDVELISLVRDLGLSLTERRFKQQSREEVFLFANRTLANGQMTTGPLTSFSFEELVHKMHEFPQDMATLQKIYELQEQRSRASGAEKRRINLQLRSTTAHSVVAGSVYTFSLLDALMKSEFGVALDKVNAEVLLDYVRLTKTGEQFKLEVIPESDEKFRVTGGTDSIINKLEERYKSKIRLNTPVVEVTQVSPHDFNIKTDKASEVIKAAHVVFAVPSYDLEKIKINSSDISPQRLREAAAQPFGTNAKIFLIFDHKFWDTGSSQRNSFAGVGVLESGVQFWDTTENQISKKGVITLYPGDWPNTKSQQDRRLQQILQQLKLVPGLENLQEHLINTDVQTWKKSYAGTFSPTYSRAPGLFAENSHANIYFVGSDKDNNSRGEISASFGYMNGAVRTALRAANRIQFNETNFDLRRSNSSRRTPTAPIIIRSCQALLLSAS